MARAAASDDEQSRQDQQIDERRPLADEQRHGSGERQRRDSQPRHTRSPAEHAIPRRRAGDQHTGQQDQAARELATATATASATVAAHYQRDDRCQPPPHTIRLREHNVDSAPGRPRWIEDAERFDLAIYAAIARTPTPALDKAMSRLSRAADYSRLP